MKSRPKMHTHPMSVSTPIQEQGRYVRPEQFSTRTSEWVYQGLTLAAMVVVLASLWVF